MNQQESAYVIEMHILSVCELGELQSYTDLMSSLREVGLVLVAR